MEVRQVKNVLVILMVLVAGAIPGHAQEQVKNKAPKPPARPSQVLLDQWNDIGRKITAMAEDFPEDKYDFKPNPAERSFAEQLLHAANANYYFIDAYLGRKQPEGDPKRDQYKNKTAIVAFVKKSFAEGAALIQAKGDGGMNEVALDPFSHSQLVRLSDQGWGFIEHAGEHYGQLVVYYRLAGLVPPESRPKK